MEILYFTEDFLNFKEFTNLGAAKLVTIFPTLMSVLMGV